MMRLPFRRMRRMRLAFSTLEAELRRLTDERKAFHLRQSLDQEQLASGPLQPERSDLLNNLVKAAMMDEGDLEKGQPAGLVTNSIQKGLTDDEIIGNTYIYFLLVSTILFQMVNRSLLTVPSVRAGHETTAHSLAWTLALLAAYPEHQDAAVKEINGVWPSSPSSFEPFYSNTTMDDYAKFPFVLACYSETLRLFPPVQMIPKITAQDVNICVDARNDLDVPQFDDITKFPTEAAGPEKENSVTRKVNFVAKKGTIVFVDPPGVRKYSMYSLVPTRLFC
jgi:hypothetical protein